MKKIIGIGIISMMLISSIAMAQEGRIQVGNVRVIPAFGISATYDDNIFLGNDQKNDPANGKKAIEFDTITHVKPGLGFEFSFAERGALKAGYEGDWAFYSDKTKNNWKNQKYLVDFNYNAPGGLIAALNNTYTHGEDPLGSREQYNVGRVTKRWVDELKGKVGYQGGDVFRVLTYYNFYKQKYKLTEDNGQNYTNNEFGLGGEMGVLPKTWAFLRYFYGFQTFTDATTVNRNNKTITVDNNNNADNKYHRISTGLNWDSGGKLGGEVSFGYQMLKYNNEYLDKTDVKTKYEDKNTWVAATSVNYSATETTNLTFNLSRALRLSGSDSNDYFSDTMIGANISQQLLGKVSLASGLSYSRNDYRLNNPNSPTIAARNEARSDDNYNFNLGVDYNIQPWLKTGIAYSYKQKNSNYTENEYKDNQIQLLVNAMY
ncbi:MAG: outer membrane beta-barrel protein [Desulfobacterales bacterium]|nr:outer membrane beta-barrel protein [Desulfobacterales bacterium]